MAPETRRARRSLRAQGLPVFLAVWLAAGSASAQHPPLQMPRETFFMPTAAEVTRARAAAAQGDVPRRLAAVCTLLDYWSHEKKTEIVDGLAWQTRPLRLTMRYREIAEQFGVPAVRRPGELLYILGTLDGVEYRLVFLGAEFHYHTAIYEGVLPPAPRQIVPTSVPLPDPAPRATPATARPAATPPPAATTRPRLPAAPDRAPRSAR